MKRQRRRFKRQLYVTRRVRRGLARLDLHSVVGHGYYRLDKKGEPVECRTLGEWSRAFKRYTPIARTLTRGLTVSTVFLGVDGSFGFGEPQLFETMVFRIADGKWFDYDYHHYRYPMRYSTRSAALAGHAEAVAWVESQGN